MTGLHLLGDGYEIRFEVSRGGSSVSFDLAAWSTGSCWGSRVAGVGAVLASLGDGGALEWSPTRVHGAGWPVCAGDVAVRLAWGVAQSLALDALGSAGAQFEGVRQGAAQPVVHPEVSAVRVGVVGG